MMDDFRNFLQNKRTQYDMGKLTRADLSTDPVEQFKSWLNDALKANVMEINAMSLATVNAEGKPSNRIVLLKGVDENGFVFFTNYNSRKAKEIAQNPYASLNFFWSELARQVRVEGKLSKVSLTDSDNYFQSRPRLSQLGAMASSQSDIIANGEVLEQRLASLEKLYADSVIPRPPHWGGYVLKPSQVEFWQGRPDRLHDRFQYSLQKNNSWKIEQLSP